MKEKLHNMLAMFPSVFATMDDNAIARMGFPVALVAEVRQEMAEEKAKHFAAVAPHAGGVPGITAEGSYAALNWNLVSNSPIHAFGQQALAPLVDVFSTDISGDAVAVTNPDAMPTITVPVYDIDEDSAVVDPVSLDELDGGKQYGVGVKLHVIGAGKEIPFSALAEGYKVVDIVKGLAETLRRKAFAYVMGQMVASGVTNTAGESVAVPETITLPGLDNGWGPGYANRKLSGVLDSDNSSLLLDSAYFAGVQPDDKLTLDVSAMSFAGVHKVRQVAGLGEHAVGLLAAPKAMAVAMRAPVLHGPAFPEMVQFTDGDTKLPITMVTYYKPGQLTMNVSVLTAIGATRVQADAARILVTA